MIKVNNLELTNQIDLAIVKYNETNENGDEIKLEGEGEYREEDLAKIKGISCIIERYMQGDEREEYLSELKNILPYLKGISNFQLMSISKEPQKIDMSFLEKLSKDVKILNFLNLDLSEEEPSLFDRFENLSTVLAQKANLKDLKPLSNLDPETFVTFEQNSFSNDTMSEVVEYIKLHKGNVRTGNKTLDAIASAYRGFGIDLMDFIKAIGNGVDFSTIEKLNINLTDIKDFDKTYEEVDLEKVVKALNNTSNAYLTADIANYEKLLNSAELTIPTRIVTSGVKNISSEFLANNENIDSVMIRDDINSILLQSEPYTREDFIAIRKEIDDIVSQITVPEENDPNRQKKMFTELYKILANRIEYNYDAISEEGQKDEELKVTCRNLKDGLLKGKCVCAGYADILRNIAECLGINCEFFGASLDIEAGVPIKTNDPEGHAWNKVELDGKTYYTDLTWDRENVVAEKYPLRYFLKNYSDFAHEQYKFSDKSTRLRVPRESLSDEEQYALFTGKELNASPEELKIIKGINALSSFARNAANRGIRSIQIREAATQIDSLKLASIGPKTDIEEER